MMIIIIIITTITIVTIVTTPTVNIYHYNIGLVRAGPEKSIRMI